MRIRRNPRFRAVFVAFIAFAFSLAAMLSSCDLPPIYEYWDSIVLNELEISPSFIALQEGQKATFSVIGGKVPYSFELSGNGAITPLPGSKVEYSAPAGAHEAWVGVRDIYDATSMARVMVEASISQLAIVPGSAALAYGQTVDFEFDGGMVPYTFRLEEGSGTVELLTATTGRYTAPAADTDAVVRLEDSSGQIADATISVRAGTQALAIIPDTLVLELSATPFKFYAEGGTGSYTFSVIGAGSITAAGDYTPSAVGSATVSVADGISTPAEASVTVVTAATSLVIIPRSIDIKMGTSFQFDADGGVPPYIFEMVSSYGGTIDASGLYTAPSTRQGVEQVQVIDSRGIRDTATVKVKKK
jgi:hypothetical protein